MEWRYIAKLFRFIESYQTAELHESWRPALRSIAWLGPRTRKARDLKLKDIFLLEEGTKQEHIRVIIRGAKTGTIRRPDQVLTVPRFLLSHIHCPVSWYKEFARSKHLRAQYLFTTSEDQKVSPKDFTDFWRGLFDLFVPTYKDLGDPCQYTFYTFRTSLVVYLAINCNFSYEEVAPITRNAQEGGGANLRIS